jgi:diguanylate cyclase (GGDEF)-like protein/PAS domain S-box-containing protein
VWHLADADRFATFRRATDRAAFAPGEGLVGHAFSSRETMWSTEAQRQLAAARNQEAQEAGIVTGCAFPLAADGAVLGVMELFSPDVVQPDPDLMLVMPQVCAYLGNAISRRTHSDEMERALSRYAAVSGISNDVVATHDVEGRFLSVSDSCATLLGYTTTELAGSSLLTYCDPDDSATVAQVFKRYLAGADERVQVHFRAHHKSGEYVTVVMSAEPLTGTYGRNREIVTVLRAAQPAQVMAAALDIDDSIQPFEVPTTTEFVWPEEKMVVPANMPTSSGRSARHNDPDRDPLTGLHNQDAVEQTLTAKLTSRRASTFPVGCLFIDIDNFDQLAETYGQDTADDIVKQVAKLLDQTCRDDDFLGRYEGSSFVVVLPNTDAGGTIIVGEKVLRKMRSAGWNESGLDEPVRVSIGGTCIRHGTMMSLSELLELLGSQLLQARASGGDCIIMNAREVLRSPFTDPLGGWHQTLRLALNGQVPGPTPGASGASGTPGPAGTTEPPKQSR